MLKVKSGSGYKNRTRDRMGTNNELADDILIFKTEIGVIRK